MNISYHELGSFFVSIVEVDSVRAYSVFSQERASALHIDINLRSVK